MEMGWLDLIFKGDSLSVVNKCRINSPDKSEIGAYIRNIQQISKKFWWVRFQHVNRKANQLSHILATECLRRNEQTYMEGGVSRFGGRRMEDDWPRESD